MSFRRLAFNEGAVTGTSAIRAFYVAASIIGFITHWQANEQVCCVIMSSHLISDDCVTNPPI